MARTREVATEDRADFRIGDPLDRPIRVRLAPGGQVDAVQPMLWPTGVAEIDASHERTGPAPDLALFVFPGAGVVGGGAMPTLDSGFIATPGIFPYYVTHFMAEGISEQFWQPPETVRTRRIPLGVSVIHHNLVFGHWLLEMLPKLLMLRDLAPHLRAAPIILPHTAPAYVFDFIRVAMGGWPIVVYDRFTEVLAVDTLICPSLCDDGYHFHPRLAGLIDTHLAWARAPAGRLGAVLPRPRLWSSLLPRRRPRLFISRSGVTSIFRALGNAPALEAVARSLGFAVIRPETLPWREQVRLFAAAECIAGEFGSGMHTALFSPPTTKVVCLNWIVDTQSRIANFRGQRVGYVLAEDGQPRLFGLDGRFMAYEIDPERFRRRLVEALEAG